MFAQALLCISLLAAGGEDPRVAWGRAQLESALAAVQAPQRSVEIVIDAAPGALVDAAAKPEGFRIVTSKEAIRVVGFDAAGVLYGCLELAQRTRALGRLPDNLDVSDAPALSLRGTCILLMKLGTYDYPITPEEFPFFYDKGLWTDYLEFLAANRFNYIAFWNGHPFDYFVRLEKYPEAQDGMDPALIARNHDLLLWLGAEAEKRNICLMFEFYNIHTSVYFQKAHKLPAWNPKPTPLLTDYTAYCIERFVSEFPNIGLYVCPGEALQLEHTADWINNVIFPAVLRTGKTPPIMIRAWAIDLEHMRQLAGHYPRLYTESKFNVEMIASTQIDPATRDWASVTGNHVVNIHCLGNLEPFRWNPPSYIRQCMQNSVAAGATGLHLYPRKAWRWPFGCDKTDTPELQWQRDHFWFEMWGRYAWNPQRDPEQERAYWLSQLEARFGTPKAAEAMLTLFEADGDVLPALQRLFWIGNDNHTVVTAGATLEQLRNAPGIPFLPLECLRVPEYLDALKHEKPLEKESPLDFLARKLEESTRACAAAGVAVAAATRNQAEAKRYSSDAKAIQLTARYYLRKLAAATAKGDASRAALQESVDIFRELTELTRQSYDSLSDVPAWNPSKELPCPYHWADVLPLYEKELARYGH